MVPVTAEHGAERRRRVPVWLFAPRGRDAALLRSAIDRGDGLRVARETRDLARGLSERDEVGVLVMTQEALTAETIELLTGFAGRQPPWAELPIILLVDPTGNTMQALGAFQDALPRTKVLVLQRPVRHSELETAVAVLRRSRLRQYDLRDYVERQELLRRELNHRVKNILATVQALYGLTVRTADDLQAFDGVFQPRLLAMARVHEVLFAADYGDASLREVIAAVLSPYAGDERVTVDGPDVLVAAETGQSLALVMHELATNAAKYGALTTAEGQVRLRWERAPTLRVRWVETGGPPAEEPARRGYGMTFIQATIRGLGGAPRFDYGQDGLAFEADIPLSEASDPADPEAAPAL